MLPTERLLESIQSFDSGGEPALSLYLLTDPSREAGRNLDAQIRGLVAGLVDEAVAPELRAAFEADTAAAREAVARLGRPPRGLAVFSCAARGFLAVVPLALPFEPTAEYGDVLQLRPLLAALDEYEHTAVVLTDKSRARFFRVFLGEIEDVLELDDEVPGRHAQGGYSQRKFQRDHELHVYWHERRVADALLAWLRREPMDRILLGGPTEAITELRRLLPPRLNDRADELPGVSLHTSAPEVLHAVLDTSEGLERNRELALVDRLGEAMGAGRALAGAEDVARAVDTGAVAVLLVAAGLEMAGRRCLDCEALLSGGTSGACSVCGVGRTEAIGDFANRLVARVIQQGGRIEEVRDEAARRLTALGGLAALLRYRAEVGQAVAGA